MTIYLHPEDQYGGRTVLIYYTSRSKLPSPDNCNREACAQQVLDEHSGSSCLWHHHEPFSLKARCLEKMETKNDDSITQSTNTPDNSCTSGSNRNKSFIICLKDAERVKLQLDKIWDDAPKNAPFINEDGDPAWGHVVLCDK